MAWNLGSIVVRFRAKTDEWSKGHKRIKADIRLLGREITALGVALTGLTTGVVKEFGTFDKALREATAVSNVTQEQFQQMSKMAEDMSVALNVAAEKGVKGFYYLGSAGLSATEQMQSYVTVTKMARAMTVDTSLAAEGLVDIMRGFNVTFTNSNHVAEMLVKTVTSSNQVFEQLRKSMSYVSATAELANNPLEDMLALLSIMADAGIKGSYAGTGLRRSLTNLIKPTAAMERLLADLNVQIYDNTGSMKPYVQIVGELSDAMKGYSDQYKNAAYTTLFGVRAVAGNIKIFQAGTEQIRKMSSAIKNSAGHLDMIVKKQMAAFLHQLGRMWQWVKRVARSLGETLVPNLRGLIEIMTPVISGLDTWINNNRVLVAGIMKTTAAVGAFALVVGPMLILLPTIVTSISMLATAFTGLIMPMAMAIGAFYALRAAWGITWDDMVNVVNDFSGKFSLWLDAFSSMWEDAFATRMLDAVKGFFNRVIDGWMKILFLMKEFLFLSEDVFDNMKRIAEAPVGDYFGATVDGVKLLGAEMKQLVHGDIAGLESTLAGMFPGLAKVVNKLRSLLLGAGTAPSMPTVSSSVGDTGGFGDTTSVARGFAADWSSATLAVVNSFDSMTQKIQTALNDVVSGWETAISDFMQLSGSFGDKLKTLMSDIFGAVYQSFVSMVANMAAEKMFRAILAPNVVSMNDPVSAGVSSGGISPGDSFMMQNAAQKPAMPSGGATVNIMNNGQAMSAKVASYSMKDRNFIINVVAETLETDPQFSESVRGR